VLIIRRSNCINPLNAELNLICHLLALLGAHHIFHVSVLRVNTASGIVFCVSDRPVCRLRRNLFLLNLQQTCKKEVAGDKYICLTYDVHLLGIKEVIDCKNARSGKLKNNRCSTSKGN